MAPLTEITNLKNFNWNDKAQAAFEEKKQWLTTAPVFALPHFDAPLPILVRNWTS